MGDGTSKTSDDAGPMKKKEKKFYKRVPKIRKCEKLEESDVLRMMINRRKSIFTLKFSPRNLLVDGSKKLMIFTDVISASDFTSFPTHLLSRKIELELLKN